jgi:hypothetical protein
MEAIMRAYIVIGALVILAISVGIYSASTRDRTNAGSNCTVDCSNYDAGYKWAEQRGIDDEDYCPDRAAYVVAAYEPDNGMGVPQPVGPDDDDDNN